MENKMTRSDYRFQQAEEGLDTGLNKTGKKNEKHRDEVLRELEATADVVQAFLRRQFEDMDPDGWIESYVATAIRDEYEEKPNIAVPTHFNLADYDLLKTLIVLARNLDHLVFERGESVSMREIRTIRFIRNVYVHLETALNTREWRSDVNLIRVFRSKFQSEVEMEREEYETADIPRMSAEAAAYEEELLVLKRRLDEYSDRLMELGDKATLHAETDQLQDAELERQAKIDAAHDEKDAEHDRLLQEVLHRLDSIEENLEGKASGQKRALVLRTVVPVGATCLASAIGVLLFSKRR